MADLEAFAGWLKRQDYRPSTYHATLGAIRAAQAAFEAGQPVQVGTHSRRAMFARYGDFLGAQGVSSDFDRAVLQALEDSPVDGHKAPRKQPAVSFTDADWQALREALGAPDCPEAWVLHAQTITGYRVGDVLRIERRALGEALRSGVLIVEVKGGHVLQVSLSAAQDNWQALYEAWPPRAPTLGAWVCPRGKAQADGGFGAYHRVRRYLLRRAPELGITSRVHTHRFRRTVGTRAIRASHDIHLVQQLLGHKSVASTERYLDEQRADEVAQLQRKLLDE